MTTADPGEPIREEPAEPEQPDHIETLQQKAQELADKLVGR
ncbi:hypothetical protein [Fodinicola acaciae]|nr:hypothetical protein [Fodinicola acaciae]